MDCLADNILARNIFALRNLLTPIFVIFLILSIFQSAPAQEPWRVFTTANSPLPSNNILNRSIVVDTNNIKWIGTENGMVRIVGNNWQVFDSTNTPFETNIIAPSSVDKYNRIWIIIYTKGVAAFDGISWIVYDTTNSGLPTNYVSRIYIDDHNIKWIGTSNGLAKFNDTNWIIYNTTNSGLPSNAISGIQVKNEIKWVATFGGGLAKFNDTNWTVYNVYNSGLPVNYLNLIQLDYSTNLWITTYGGGLAKYDYITNDWVVYTPTNSGISSVFTAPIVIKDNIKWIGCFYDGGLNKYDDTNWNLFKTINSPLPNDNIVGLSYDKHSNLWIGTINGLAIYNPNGIIGINNTSEIAPVDFLLYQNYPNPYNPITNIKYQIVKSSNVKLIIYDVQGKEIKTLVNSYQRAGIYEVLFDGTNSPSGIYFYKLETENYSETKKMVLVK